MCGLVGMALKTLGGASNIDLAIFNDLLYMDALRGFDATGVASFHNNGEMNALKEASEATFFFSDKKYDAFGKAFVKNGKAIMGHNRKATMGSAIDANAHPFILENEDGDTNFAFMHNGTLRNHDQLHKTDVDSEALGMLLTACGEDKAKLEEALDKVQGAYACTWIDQDKEKLYLIRNKERPLWIGETGFGFVYASEPVMIMAACTRNSTKVENIRELKVHTLYSISLKTYTLELEEMELSVKKFSTIPHILGQGAKGGGVTKSTTTFSGGQVSKNEFKRIRKALIGTTQLFWVADYRPRIIGDLDCTEWDVWGDNDVQLPFDHEFKGFVKGFKEDEMLWCSESVPMQGKVEDLIYRADKKRIDIMMGEVGLTKGSSNVPVVMESASSALANWKH